ncbi:hypothetical protein AB0O47_40015 [Streptomyces noursei]|uniref:hypothetical protein n=1 Tax=Streptomyces noursei TaxID=1971 RepID=UPI0034503FDA
MLLQPAACQDCKDRAARIKTRCIRCYATHIEASNDQRIRQGLPGNASVFANFVSDPCIGCDSEDVDANDTHFWCRCCGMTVRHSPDRCRRCGHEMRVITPTYYSCRECGWGLRTEPH